MGRRWYWWQSVVKAALCIEGGGTGSLPRIVRGGGRQQTFEQFSEAVSSGRTEELTILLVDSEGLGESGRYA